MPDFSEFLNQVESWNEAAGEQATEPRPTALQTATIEPGSGTISVPATGVLPYAVDAGHIVQVVVEAQFSANKGSKVWNGSLAATAKRPTGGSLIITSQNMGIPLELTDSAWNPRFTAVGNDIQLQVTADTVYQIVPRGSVSIVDIDTSGDPTTADWRGAVIKDGYQLLLFSDTGLTTSGSNITAWADQSGNASNIAFAAGNQPVVASDGTHTVVDALAATQVLGTSAAAIVTGPKSFRWTMNKLNPSVASTEILFFTNANFYILLHCNGTGLSDGTHIAIQTNTGGFVDLGVCPSGKHDYEIYLDGTNVYLFVDGVQTATAAFTDSNAYPLPGANILGYNGSSWSCDARIYGMGFSNGPTTADARAHWIGMSQAMWGPHD